MQAAERLLHVEHCDEHGHELLAIARRIVETHLQEHQLRDESS